MYTLRKAVASDALEIRRLIMLVHINPIQLNWRRFVVALDENGRLVGCGQVKPHAGDLMELASIGVHPQHRGRGLAGAIIERLLEQHPARLYLTCRSSLREFYEKFGFGVLPVGEMPPYYRTIWVIVNGVRTTLRRPEALLVMRRDPPDFQTGQESPTP